MAKISPGSFAKKLRAFAKDLPRQQNEIKKATAIEIATNLVADTPIDTGEAASGWNAGLGAPATGSGGSGANGPMVALYNIGATVAKAKPGDRIFISNRVPHIEYLNQGWSPQAPAGYIEAAILRGKAVIQRQKLRYGVK